MDEEHTRQTLDALGDLFLTNSVPGTPVAPKSDESDHGSRPPVDDDSPVPMRLVPKVAHGPEMNTHDTSVAATPDPTMTLRYHGENDETHMQRFYQMLNMVAISDERSKRIIKTARVVGRLYAMQLEELDVL